jgi:hypothetical protein
MHGECCHCAACIPSVLTVSVPAENFLLQAPASPCLRALSGSKDMLGSHTKKAVVLGS